MIPALNRDGDILSDLVLPLFGSIAGSESLLVAFDDDYVPAALHGRGGPRHGAVAPGQERREPDGDDPRRRGAALTRAARTTQTRGAGDPRGVPRGGRRRACAPPTSAATAATTEFTDEVIGRVRAKLEVWAAL